MQYACDFTLLTFDKIIHAYKAWEEVPEEIRSLWKTESENLSIKHLCWSGRDLFAYCYSMQRIFTGLWTDAKRFTPDHIAGVLGKAHKISNERLYKIENENPQSGQPEDTPHREAVSQ